MRERDALDAPVPGSPSDPTMVTNQPALRTASGSSWLIASTALTAICLIPLIAIAASGGTAGVIALVAAVVLVCLLATMFVVRFTVLPQRNRLRWLAACMLAMALVALGALAACTMMVWASVRR